MVELCLHTPYVFMAWCLSKPKDKPLHGRWDSSVNLGKGYGLDSLILIPGRCKGYLSSPKHPDWLWGTPSLLYNGYQVLETENKAAGA
jgi:hypothetical protein